MPHNERIASKTGGYFRDLAALGPSQGPDALNHPLPQQMLIVAENPNQYVDTYSQEFIDNFLHHLKRTRGTKRVLSNTVYNEIVALVFGCRSLPPHPLPHP